MIAWVTLICSEGKSEHENASLILTLRFLGSQV